ncbi:hypothetical protein E2C01_055421 [Portunus trituberculatus]|uniref:Uncharacterized protein n=1 Tax=Portunus trituberculatus TaxID=210409 RepID=A0A5B7GMN0_PORTR|nr:hypothetical protein [Portunus trituberculatus]
MLVMNACRALLSHQSLLRLVLLQHTADISTSTSNLETTADDTSQGSEVTSRNLRDPEGGNGIPSDDMSVLLGSDIEDSDENEDSNFFIEIEESEDSSSDSDSDLGDRDQPSQQRL